jgi:hypothetical protein
LPEEEAALAALERLIRAGDEIYRGYGLLEDSTNLIRQQRNARTHQLANR